MPKRSGSGDAAPSSFDPVAYWNARPNPNASPVAPDWMKRFVSDHVARVTRVLELGPGVGRTLDVYRPGQRITTLDLSRLYAGKLAARAEDLGLTLEQHWLDHPDAPFPFEDRAFDCAVCVQVLMHVPPAHIAHSLGELARVATQAVIVTTLNPGWTDRVRHCFNHDYEALSLSVGCTAEVLLRTGDQIGFLLRRADRPAA